jgi:hypothetical protein
MNRIWSSRIPASSSSASTAWAIAFHLMPRAQSSKMMTTSFFPLARSLGGVLPIGFRRAAWICFMSMAGRL